MTVRRCFLALLLLGMALPPAAAAEMNEAERAERWADLAHALFGDRSIEDAGDALGIDAPARAENAALVPITLHLADPLAADARTLYLVIDNNPSPLAAVFHFGPLADRSEVATRVRVDDYTYLHAVAETADGTLHGARRFVKASGGCSAPEESDPAAALARLGRMKLSFAPPRPGRRTGVQLLISHPNSSGLQMDQLTHTYIPADFIQQIRVTYAGVDVLTVDSDIALSEDPSIRFGLLPRAPGEIEVEVDDSRQRHFTQRWPLPAVTD
ncbi:MAG TPA: quinoprotein dehydrogenase-associated SoxYZ-like carrier [Stellaceae bacterium]|nr:quinoprotein dehydrogenase-associated SoxYZ-like carrier [Stellaceae bacterium]